MTKFTPDTTRDPPQPAHFASRLLKPSIAIIPRCTAAVRVQYRCIRMHNCTCAGYRVDELAVMCADVYVMYIMPYRTRCSTSIPSMSPWDPGHHHPILYIIWMYSIQYTNTSTHVNSTHFAPSYPSTNTFRLIWRIRGPGSWVSSVGPKMGPKWPHFGVYILSYIRTYHGCKDVLV